MRRRITLMIVVGARPQFIKAAAMGCAIQAWNEEGNDLNFEGIIIHTGQHYDYELSQAFFDELEIPRPKVNLDVKSASHAVQSSQMLIGLEKVMAKMLPNWVIVLGDTNSTLAGVLAAAKLKIPVAHVEAGLREHNRHIPEEVNKIVADHLSDLCLAPTVTAMENLRREGLASRSLLVGDIMLDTTVRVLKGITEGFVEKTLANFGLTNREFALATTHRAIIRETPELLRHVLEALREMPFPVILPLHPSTRSAIRRYEMDGLLAPGTSLHVVPPVKYSEMLVLLRGCRMVFTDSGGLIKETYYFQKPCITLDYQTEWTETLEGGWNVIAGPSKSRILHASATIKPDPTVHKANAFGIGQTARRVLKALSATG